MKRDNVNYLLVGLFTLGMFALLLVALFRITGRDVSAETYYALFTQVPGIRNGTAVTYGGYRIGQVVGIRPLREENHTRYRITLALRADWQIPNDSTAYIVAPGLLSDKVVNIEEGRSTQMLEPGATLSGADPQDLFATMNRVALELEALSREGIRPLLSGLSKQAGQLADNAGATLGRVSVQVERLLATLNRSAEELNRLLSPDNRQRVTAVLTQGERITRDLAQLAGEFRGAGQQLERMLSESRSLVTENRADLRATVESLRDVLGTVAQNMDSIVHNLDSTSRNFSEFSREIRQNPGRLLGGDPPADKAAE